MQPLRYRVSSLVRNFPFAVLLALVAPVTGASWAETSPAAQTIAVFEQALTAAETALETGEIQIAESRYRSALLEGWLLLGSLAIEEEKLAQAEAAFRHAANSTVESRRPLTSLALVLLEAGNAEEALRILRSLVVQNPDDLAARRLLARALAASDRLDEAIQELEQLLALDPGNLETAFLLATGHLRRGRPESAEPYFTELTVRRPIPQTWVLIGRVQRDYGNYDLARKALETALELDPQVRRAHYYLGSVDLLEQGRGLLDQAMAHFQAELDLAPADPLANLHLGIALVETRRYQEAVERLEIARREGASERDTLQFLGRTYLALDRAADAVPALRRALELALESANEPAEDLAESQVASLHYQLALALRRAGDEAAAAPHFEASKESSARAAEGSREFLDRYLKDEIRETRSGAGDSLLGDSPLAALPPQVRADLAGKIATSLAQSYLNLGVLLIRNDHHARAAELFEQTAELDPDFPNVQFSLGVARFNAGQFERAAGPLARANDLRPDDENLKRMLALAWLNSGSYDRAVDLLRDDAGRATNASLQYAYGLALVRSARAAEAEAVFARLLTENADWPELNVVLGQAHAQQDDYEQAIRFLERAIELKPAVPEAHATLGDIYLRQGRLDDAETELRAELRLDPANVRALYTLAVVLDLNRKSDDAMKILRSLLARSPRLADGHYLLGKILMGRGEFEPALEQLQSAAALAPEDPNVRYQLGQAYQKLGRTDEAEAEFESFRRLKDEQRSGGASS